MINSVPTIRSKGKPPGLRDIANALDLSTGTVDRALHGKPGVSPMTRQRVLSMAQTMRYRPNLAARSLSSRKEIRIAVNLPKTNCQFFDDVLSGIEQAARISQGSQVTILPRRYPWTWEAEVEALEAALGDGISALIIAPGDTARLKPLLRQAAQRKLPVLCVTSDSPGVARLASISVDHAVSGSIAAELMGQVLAGHGSVLLVTGSLAISDHAEKVMGFQNCMYSPNIRVAGIIEDHESEEESYKKCKKALLDDPTIKGIYATTANSVPLLRALDELGLAGKLKVVATDLFPELLAALQSGVVAAILYQKPFDQGWIGFQALYQFVAENICPPAQIKLAPDIVIRANLEMFLARQGRTLLENRMLADGALFHMLGQVG
jgi:LacI family transcriptional regulator